MNKDRKQYRNHQNRGSLHQQLTQINNIQVKVTQGSEVSKSPIISKINNQSKLIEQNNLLSNNYYTDRFQSKNNEQNLRNYKSVHISQQKLPKIPDQLTFSHKIDEKQKQPNVPHTRIIKNHNQNSLKLPSSYIQNKSEKDQDEFNIWGAELGQELYEKERLNEILLLLKYRIETYEKDKKDRNSISCNDVIIQAQRLAKKNRKTWLKYFGLAKKLDWIEFRNFTDF